MTTIRLKGRRAGNFFASLMVENDGENALKHCAEGSPMWFAVKEILDNQSSSQKANKAGTVSDA